MLAAPEAPTMRPARTPARAAGERENGGAERPWRLRLRQGATRDGGRVASTSCGSPPGSPPGAAPCAGCFRPCRPLRSPGASTRRRASACSPRITASSRSTISFGWAAPWSSGASSTGTRRRARSPTSTTCSTATSSPRTRRSGASPSTPASWPARRTTWGTSRSSPRSGSGAPSRRRAPSAAASSTTATRRTCASSRSWSSCRTWGPTKVRWSPWTLRPAAA